MENGGDVEQVRILTPLVSLPQLQKDELVLYSVGEGLFLWANPEHYSCYSLFGRANNYELYSSLILLLLSK